MKKFLCSLLCIALVMAMMPMVTGVAFAGEPDGSEDNPWEIGAVTSSDVKHGLAVLRLSSAGPMQ